MKLTAGEDEHVGNGSIRTSVVGACASARAPALVRGVRALGAVYVAPSTEGLLAIALHIE